MSLTNRSINANNSLVFTSIRHEKMGRKGHYKLNGRTEKTNLLVETNLKDYK